MTQPVNPGMFAQTLAATNPQQYGQFTGYQRVPGGYNFDMATGGVRTIQDSPGAENLVKQIDAAKAYQPGQGPMAGPAGPGGAPAQAADPGRYQLLTTEKDGSQIFLKPGGDPRNPMDLVKQTAGRAGTKGGMAARGMTTQGGYNVDETFLDQMEGSQIKMAAAQERGQIQGLEAAKERQGYMEAQKAQAEREIAVQAHENAQKQQQLASFQAKYDKAEQDYTGFSKEKEAEANSPKAKLGTFIGALSSALGALGAGLARTPNFAAEAVARHNEMQLRREEAELRVRKDTRDSMLGQLQQQMGSLDLARNAYRAMQAKQSAMGWEMLAQKEQDQGKQQQLLQVAELQNQQYLKWREAYVRGAEGEVTRTFQYVPGQSASGPRRTGVSLEETGKLGNIAATAASTDKTRADTAAALNPQASPEQRSAQVERTNALTAAGNAIDAARRIELNLKARGMGAENTADDPLSGGYDAAASGASALVGGDRSKLDNQLKADTFALARGAQTSLGKSDNDAKMADAMAQGGGSAADRLRAAHDIKERAIKTVQTELSTLPPAQQKVLISSLSPEAQKEILGQ